MEIKELTNGNYWLVQVSYPIAGQATLYYTVKSKENPNNNTTFREIILSEWISECIEDYSYLDCPQSEDFETEEEYEQEYDYWAAEEEYEQEYDYWSENIRGDVEVDIDKITPKIIDDFGENFYAFKDVNYEID